MPTLPSRYRSLVTTQMLRMRRHCSLWRAEMSWLVPSPTETVICRPYRQSEPLASTAAAQDNFQVISKAQAHLYRCLWVYDIGSRTHKEQPPIRLPRDRGLMLSACRAHSDRQVHRLGKASLRHVTSTFGVSNGADGDRLGMD